MRFSDISYLDLALAIMRATDKPKYVVRVNNVPVAYFHTIPECKKFHEELDKMRFIGLIEINEIKKRHR